MADDDPTPNPGTDPDDPDAGAKKALEAERKARRDAERQLREMGDQLKAMQDKDKSDSERLAEQVATLTKERDGALLSEARLKAAVSKGLPEDHAKRVIGAARRISGDSPDDLEADAAEYFESLGAPAAGDPNPAPGKPTESLGGGGDPTQEPEVDVRQVVDSIPRGL